MGELFDRALAFAAEKHKGQKRKFSGADYITHPLAVAGIVKKWNGPEWVQAVAVLHDVIEDCDVTHADLVEEFGELIADTVRTLSAKNNESYLDFVLRAMGSQEARVVKLADIQHNMSDMPARNRTMKAKYELAQHILKNSLSKRVNISFSPEDWVCYLEMALVALDVHADTLGVVMDISDKELERLHVQLCEAMNTRERDGRLPEEILNKEVQ